MVLFFAPARGEYSTAPEVRKYLWFAKILSVWPSPSGESGTERPIGMSRGGLVPPACVVPAALAALSGRPEAAHR